MDNLSNVIEVMSPESGILQIHLNRPKQLNALSHEVLKSLSQILEDAKQDKSVKAILLTGEGKGFCAGADIKELAGLNGNSGVEFARFGQAVMTQLEMLGKPSLAAIQGFAFGGGCELAMSASLRIASDQAQFAQPEIKLGIIPGYGGTQRLARLIGKGRAIDLCLTGRRISAQHALACGLVSEVTSTEQLLPRAYEILTDLVAQAPIAARYILDVIHHGYDLSLTEALNLEANYFGLCCVTADKTEGVSAFIEKRKANFTGS